MNIILFFFFYFERNRSEYVSLCVSVSGRTKMFYINILFMRVICFEIFYNKINVVLDEDTRVVIQL